MLKLPELPKPYYHESGATDYFGLLLGYTHKDMKAYGRACADAALEAAAQVCDVMQPRNQTPLVTLQTSAHLIRALKENP